MISIIIPTYNHAGALVGCFDSIRAQDFQDFEVIVIDDGSDDNTEEVVKDYLFSSKDKRFHYQRLAHFGAPTARNIGAKIAQGEYLLFLDADIIMRSNALLDLKIALESHSEASYAYSSFIFGHKLFRGRPFSPEALKAMNYIHTSALIRCEHFLGFDESLKKFQDWDLWLTMLEKGYRGVFVPEVLFRIRITKKGISTWQPKIAYSIIKLIQQFFHWAPEWYYQYEEGKKIIQEKHKIS